ncbi:hypothetical protein Hanom_Chr05g00399851 [Helianthus anomalus]
MTTVEEVLTDRVNYLTLALEDSFGEINFLHQRLNILVMPPIEPILPQDDWNITHEVINPTGWDEIHPKPPINAHFEVLVNPAPLPQEEVDDDLFIFLPREIQEMFNNVQQPLKEHSWRIASSSSKGKFWFLLTFIDLSRGKLVGLNKLF